MGKREQLEKMYRDALGSVRASNKRDFAALVGVNYSNLSAALNGTERYLTERFIQKVEAALIPVPLDDPLAWRVPLLPLDAHGGSLVDFEGSVQDYECEQVVSPVRGASYAIHVAGDSMAPAYPNGCRVLIHQKKDAAGIAASNVIPNTNSSHR